jgi:hypothetical protein
LGPSSITSSFLPFLAAFLSAALASISFFLASYSSAVSSLWKIVKSFNFNSALSSSFSSSPSLIFYS